MKKSILLATTTLLAFLSGCVCPAPVTSVPTSGPISVEDGVGNIIAFESEPQRIVSLAPNHTEILYALGLGDRVVGVTEYCNYPPEAAAKPKVGDFIIIFSGR